MDLKNAVAVCLISLFSATLVVLIVRVLDAQAASRLEPKLTEIADELRALRKQGGLATATPGVASASKSPAADGLIVYYLHGSIRCPTCLAIETQAQETVQKDFAVQLGSKEIIWKTENFEQPAGRALAEKFQISMPMVVLARVKAGQVQDWKRLDKVWALVEDKPAFASYVRDEIQQFIIADGRQSAPALPITIQPANPVSDPRPSDLVAPKPLPAIPIPD